MGAGAQGRTEANMPQGVLITFSHLHSAIWSPSSRACNFVGQVGSMPPVFPLTGYQAARKTTLHLDIRLSRSFSRHILGAIVLQQLMPPVEFSGITVLPLGLHILYSVLNRLLSEQDVQRISL